MTAKGYTGLSDAAERHIRELVRMGWAPENARRMVEPIARAERNRTIASLRGRLSRVRRRFHEASPYVTVADVIRTLDEMEEVAP